MQIIAFLNQKGGSGKTTLAVHAAMAAHEAGRRVLLVDTDPQGTAYAWRTARGALYQNGPQVVAGAAVDLSRIIAGATRDGIDLILVDTAPHAAPAATAIARLADLVLIPLRPSAFDLRTAPATVAIVRAARAKGAFVLSAAPFRAPEIPEARAALDAMGLPVAPGEITDRRAFSRAVASGRAVTEFEPQGRAAAEIRALWNWLDASGEADEKTDWSGNVQHRPGHPAEAAP